MPKYLKLTLDIVIGAIVPVVILKYGTAPLGTLPAYLAAALIPVAWVLLDLLVLTRRFNFITTYGGLGAIMRGALAFWYVSGALFAFKDSASYLLAVVIFGGTLFIGKPVTRAIALQGLGPDTPEREASLERLLDHPTVYAKLRLATIAIALTNLAAGAFNYWINFHMVKAPFGTPLFNDQVANVNAITRIVLSLPDMICIFWAFSAMYKAIYALLPPDQTDNPKGDEFWDLVERREASLVADAKGDLAVETEAQAQTRANRQARGEFGLV